MNHVERMARRFDSWQQRHPPMAFTVAVMKKFGDDQAGNHVALLTYYAFVATFPLLLALTTILGVALRKNPELQRDLVNSAFAEFPIIGAQLHDQLGVATFGNAFSLTVGVGGALFGGRGFANALLDTFSSLWSVPKVDRPGLPTRYLRAAGLLLLLTVGAAVTAAAGGLPVRRRLWDYTGWARV
jgi:membrane protein